MILDDVLKNENAFDEGGVPENIPFNNLGFFLLIFLGIFFGSIFIMGLIFGGIELMTDASLTSLLSADYIENTADNRFYLRWTLFLSHIFQFILPGLLISYFTIKAFNNKIQYKWSFDFKIAGLSIILLLVSLPFLQFTQWFNTIIPIPESLMDMEDSTNAMLKVILTMDNIWELVITTILVGVTPAFGEEYLFRGLIQKQLNRVIDNPHIGIWITAIAFSAMHMQFNGFLPRLFLGLGLGYIFYWSKNLLVPIVIHFLFNTSQVVFQYIYKLDLDTVHSDSFEDLTWYSVLISATLMGLTIYYIIQRMNRRLELNP